MNAGVTNRDRHCICGEVCGFDDPDYGDECEDAGCSFCADQQARVNTPPMPGETPLFGAAS